MSKAMSKEALELAKDIWLHRDVITEKINILGQSGGGKTYTAMKLAELMLAMLGRIFVFDLVGVWHGLLSSADGLHPGFPVLVIGGEHGHLPLNPGAGRLLADLAVDRDVSVIVDCSELFAEDEDAVHQLVADCLHQLFKRHQKTKTRRHIFYEEAQELFPEENPTKAQFRLRRIGKTVCKIGRNYGLGYTTISQEPQSVSKRILNQAGTLIAVRTIGMLEGKAIEGTVRNKALDLINVLPTLETSEAIIYSPAWLKFSGRVRILKKVTFDSSRTPDGDEEVAEPKVLATVELEQLRAAMASAIAEVEANDPAALQRRVRQLEAELAARPPPAPPERVEVPVPTQRGLDALIEVEHQLLACTRALRELQDTEGFRALGGLRAEQRGAGITTAITVPAEMAAAIARAPKTAVKVAAPPKRHRTGGEPSAGDATEPGHPRLLTALLERGPITPDRLAALTGFAETGGGFRKALKGLREGLLIEEADGSSLRLTAAGRQQLQHLENAGSFDLASSVSRWSEKLGPGPWALVEVLAGVESMSPSALAKAVAMSETGGGFRKNLKKLRGSGLVEKDKTKPVRLTRAARELLEGTERQPAKTHEQIADGWRAKLNDGPRGLLESLLKHHPARLTGDELAERVGMVASGGGFRKNLKKLRTLGLVVETDGGIAPSPALWP